MPQIDAARLPISQTKATSILKGCKLIKDEGWHPFKRRPADNYRTALEELPGIKEKTRQLMAMRLGLEDTEKCDTWMVQCAEACDTTVDELVTCLSEKFKLRSWEVDNYLWRYCRDNQEQP